MKYNLSDIVEVTMGQSPKSEFYNNEGKGYPFLQGNRTFGFKRPTFDTYTTAMTKLAKAGDIIMSVRAPVGDLNITPVDMCLGRGVCSLRMRNGNQDFLFYLMKYIMPQLLSKESGTVFGSVNRNDINALEVDIPSNDETQRKIARYLTMIDDKIELNMAINNNLLDQAVAFFSESFASDSSLAQVKIGDIALNVTDGVHNTVIDDPDGDCYLLSCKNIKGGILSIGVSERRINRTTFDKLRKRTKLSKGDILISSVGTVGELLLLNEEPSNYEFQRSVAIVKPNTEIVSSVYLYLSLVTRKAELINAAHGAVQQCLFISDIAEFPITIPNKQAMNEFTKIVVPLFEMITANEQENKRLSELRDALLTKLMSGELDVSAIEI